MKWTSKNQIAYLVIFATFLHFSVQCHTITTVKTFKNLAEFWRQYYLLPPQIAGNDAWSIVFTARDGNGLFLSLANPFTEEHSEVFVTYASDNDYQTFTQHYKQRLQEQIPLRFGFFRPGVDKVLTEYPAWDTFYSAWLNDNPTLLQGNMPLLFDYPSKEEYHALQLKGADFAGYRRLHVVLYQYRKQEFQRIFIQSVDDTAFSKIRQQIYDMYERALPEILSPENRTT